MTSKITLSAIMLTVICLFTSCLSNDNETVTYDDTAVTTFTLGTVRCYRTIKSYDGLRDSTYSYTYSAATIPVFIDQVNKRIYNEDPLSVGTDLSRVLVTVATKNNGIALFKNIDDEQWSYYSSADSVDLSTERTLRVVSSDGLNTTDYKVNIVRHNEYADSFAWKRMPAEQTIATFTDMKAVKTGDKVFILGKDATGNAKLLATTDGTAWNKCTLPSTNGMSTATIADIDDVLTIYADGNIFSSTDGEQWTAITPNTTLKALIGGCKGEMYATATDGRILVSTDNGATWTPDAMESTQYVDNTQNLPVADITLLASTAKTNSEIQRVTLIGRKADNTTGEVAETAVVWNKVVDPDQQQTWTYTNVADENKTYRLPQIKDISATAYADGIIILGDTALNNSEKSMPTMYYSPDLGATWHKEKGITTPQDVAGCTCSTIVADGKGFIYIIAANPNATEEDARCVIWKGKKNSVLWKKE